VIFTHFFIKNRHFLSIFCLFFFNIAIECNPHTVWVIAYHEVFSDCVKYIDRLQAQLPASIEAGSIEDAFMFLDGEL
jgi:hypothetical protein